MYLIHIYPLLYPIDNVIDKSETVIDAHTRTLFSDGIARGTLC